MLTAWYRWPKGTTGQLKDCERAAVGGLTPKTPGHVQLPPGWLNGRQSLRHVLHEEASLPLRKGSYPDTRLRLKGHRA